MGLDIRFSIKGDVICPHCGKVVDTKTICVEDSSGNGWYSILKQLGYYVPYKERTDENNWYGKDMMLTEEQVKLVYDFIKKNPELYRAYTILGLAASAIVEGYKLIVNADW